MKTWVFPCLAALLAGLAWAWYQASPAPVGEAENPMLWASDRWTEWRCLPLEDGEGVSRVFRDAAGLEVTHVEGPPKPCLLDSSNGHGEGDGSKAPRRPWTHGRKIQGRWPHIGARNPVST